MTYQHIKKMYPKHNTAWSSKEINTLITARQEKKSWTAIGEFLQRKPSSCAQKYSTIKKETKFVSKPESPVVKATPVTESNFELNRKVKGITVEVNGISTTIDFDGEYLRIKI